MNHQRLFWHLFRFHFQLPPWYLLPFFVLLILIISLGMNALQWGKHGIYLGSYRNNEQLMFFFYLFLVAAQMSWGMQWGRSTTQGQSWATGNYAFLFSRAIHRPTLYWAKLAVFFCLCVIPIFPSLTQAILQPDIRIELFKSGENEKLADYQAHYPSLTVSPPEKDSMGPVVTLPGAGWDRFSLKAAQVLLMSLTILYLSTLSRRWPKIWIAGLILFLLAMMGPLIMTALTRNPVWTLFFEDEATLFWVHAHALIIWPSLIGLTTFIIWDSRQRFLRAPMYKTTLA